jgi:hypothetical protein
MCSYCGVQWRRSQLTRDESGNLVCPDEGSGKDELELSRGNAEGAAGYRQPVDGDEGGAMDQDITQPGEVIPLATTIGGVTF